MRWTLRRRSGKNSQLFCALCVTNDVLDQFLVSCVGRPSPTLDRPIRPRTGVHSGPPRNYTKVILPTQILNLFLNNCFRFGAFCFFSALGQYFIFTTIKHFGPLTVSIFTTCRYMRRQIAYAIINQ